MSDIELSAHDILAAHVTNVSLTTANVIRRALKEYEALSELRMGPVLLQLDAMRSEIAKLTEMVKQFAEAPQNGSSR
jgi:hypothetical protein